MAFDRNKFKGGNREAQKEVQSKEPKGGSSGNDWLRVEEGRNEFRLAPPHKEEHSTYELYRTASIDCDVPVYVDGEKTEKIERKRRKIVSATVHSEFLKDLGKEGDPIELYIKLITDIAHEEITDKNKRNKHLAPITGFRSRDGKWNWGITPMSSYLVYAWDADGKLGKLELFSKWVREMDKISAELESEGDVLDVDPFSNIDEGYPIIINKDKNDKGKMEYSISKASPSRAKKETYEDFFARTAITNEQLEDLSKKKSLYDGYVNSYNMYMFDLAVNGLQIFDENNDYKLFENEEFLNKLKVISDLVEENEPTEENDESQAAGNEFMDNDKPKAKKAAKKKAVKKSAPQKPDVNEEMYLDVKEYVTDIYGEEYVEQIPKIGSEELEVWFEIVVAKEANGDLDLEAIDEEAAKEVEVEVEEVEAAPVEVDDEVRKQIANLRKRRK